MRRSPVLPFAIAALLAAACGDDDTTTPDAAGPDGAGQIDAARPPDAFRPDARVTCSSPAEGYGAMGPVEGVIDPDYADPTENVWWAGALNDETRYDELWLDLYAGYGAFSGKDVVPGTYSLTGEGDYQTCGACVMVYADVGSDGYPEQVYIASGGTLEITSVTPFLTGTLTNATLQHVEIAEDGTTTVASDCETSIASLEFDAGLPGATVDLQILGITDWHGQLQKVTTYPGPVVTGGAAELAAYWAADRTANPNTLVVSAGDNIGASPVLSSYLEDEPAMEALDLMGLDVSTFGNHEFDRGLTVLDTRMDGSDVVFTSANLDGVVTNLPATQVPYTIVEVGHVKVAVIGLTTPEAPALVFPGAMGSLSVLEPVAQAQAARTAAEAAGATVFVGAFHIGVSAYDAGTSTYSGPLIDVASALTGFDLIIGGHTHFADANTTAGGAVVVQPQQKGGSYARVALEVDAVTGGVVTSTTELVPALSDAVTPEPAIVTLIDGYKATLQPLFDVSLGVAADIFPRGSNVERLGEVALGDLVTDALRWKYGTQLAFVNGGGLRAPLPSTWTPASTALRRTTTGYAAGPPYDLVLGDAYEVLPFGNLVITRTITGALLWDVLEFGYASLPSAAGKFPQISGFRVTVDLNQPAGTRVTAVELDNGDGTWTPIPDDASATYTLALPDMINLGGDGYAMLNDGTGAWHELMADVLAEYITDEATITPTTNGRITIVPATP